MNISTFNSSDLNLLSALQPDGWGDIKPSYDFYTKSSFCFPVKISIDDEIVGVGTTILHHDVAWLAHIIVHKEHRKKGIGKLVTETLVNSLRSTNCETIYLLATELGAPVYEKCGFETETEYLFFKDIKIEKNVSTSVAIQSYQQKFKEQIAVIDKSISGEERMFHLEDHLLNGFVYVENDLVSGFYLPTFGDGLILALHSTAGLELLQFHLNSHDKLVFPKENLDATNYLYKKGHKEILRGKRMWLGKRREVKLEHIYNRIGGNLG
jgi:N-acetylglutamate synthase-like GNAT family acetyltransferase